MTQSQPKRSDIEGVPASPPHSVSGTFQDYNDPASDSLFEKVDDETNRCLTCGQLVYNNTESRDGHLNQADHLR